MGADYGKKVKKKQQQKNEINGKAIMN